MKSTSDLLKLLALIVTTAIVAVTVEHFYLKGPQTSMFVFSWILIFMLMMWTTLIPAQLRPSLNFTYFNSLPFENNGQLYEKLGINLYRKLLVFIGWEKVIKKATPIKSDLKAIVKYEATMRWSELAHLVIMLVMLCVTVQVGLQYGFIKTLWLNFFNLLFNVYPVMLQRYNRPRLQRVVNIHNKVNARSLTSIAV